MIDHPPAIVQVRQALDLRLHINGEQVENPLPRDFLSMPPVLRATVTVGELRTYLPAEYRPVPDGLLASLLYANLPGFPGALMAGTIKKGWLYTSNGQFTVPGDWNKRDNIIHALAGGGNGGDGWWDALPNGDILSANGGGGGGGGAWAALINAVLQFHALLDLVVAPGGTSSTSTWFSATDVLLAKSGAMGFGSSGGAGGTAASSVGDQANDGGNGDSTGNTAGGRGGGAGGPHGAGTYDGDAGYGGASGSTALGGDRTGGDGVDGPAGGFDPKGKVNAGSGGGGYLGFSDQASGGNGGLYGGAGGGGGATFDVTRPGGLGRQGCLLLINNTRA